MNTVSLLAQTPNLWNQFLTATVAGLVTVSYTHLRAHETVLDLVCRLLLEKKNKKNKKKNADEQEQQHN